MVVIHSHDEIVKIWGLHFHNTPNLPVFSTLIYRNNILSDNIKT